MAETEDALGLNPSGHQPVWVRVPPPALLATRGDCIHAPLAQLAEQRTFNPMVLGSNPRGRTAASRGAATADEADGLANSPMDA